MTKGRRLKSLEDYHRLIGSVGVNDTMAAIARLEENEGRSLDESERLTALYVGGYVAAFVTHRMFAEGVAPVLKQLRRYTVLLVVSLILTFGAVAYSWFTGDAASFRSFAVIFVPGLLGITLTAVKAWKTWAEGVKALAEADKARAELKTAESG